MSIQRGDWVAEVTGGLWGQVVDFRPHGRVTVEWHGPLYATGPKPWLHQRPSLSRPRPVIDFRVMTAAERAQALAATTEEVEQ